MILKEPANIEAEQAVLGACLMSRDALARVAEFLEPRHFAEGCIAGSMRRCNKSSARAPPRRW